MTKNESKLLSLQWIAKTSAFCLLLSAFSVNAAMAVPASVGTVDEAVSYTHLDVYKRQLMDTIRSSHFVGASCAS